MPTPTVRLHRVLRAPSERVCRAFLDADALAKRLPPDGYTFGFTRGTRVLEAVSRMPFSPLLLAKLAEPGIAEQRQRRR